MSTDNAASPAKHRLRVSDVIVVHPSGMKSALRGAIVGNFMEWFDFGIYGYLAVTMHHVFFSSLPDNVGLLVTFLGFAVSFLVRPLGGMILGPLGDKIGRQKVLFLTMAIMATATALIGMMPTAENANVWVIITVLYLLKMMQGFSTGGEYAGATTYVSEFSPDKRRGFYASWLDVGSYLGFAAGASVVALCFAVLGTDTMNDWGWRVPFLLAIPLGAVAIYFRMRIPETPSFEAEASEEETTYDPNDRFARHGLGGIVRLFWREILIGIAIVSASMTISYALTSYMPAYLELEIGLSNIGAAMATVPILVGTCVALPFIGRWSDRVGRKRVYAFSFGLTILMVVPAFWVMHFGTFFWVMVALVMVAIPAALSLALGASALPALFPTASRFGAMGLTFNIAVSAFGGTTALISQALIDATGNSYMPAFYITFFAVIALLALIPMRETARRPLLGSFPTVNTIEEAEELVATQYDNPDLDHDAMPFDVVKADSH